jgi:hypothetical protein
MTDFSHLPALICRPELVQRMAARGEDITDEILLDIFERIDPPLLTDQQNKAVKAILGRRRGRPPKKGVPSRNWLGRRIANLDRPDVHAQFLEVLARRITSQSPPPISRTAQRRHRRIKYDQRDTMISGLYWQMRSMLHGNPQTVSHSLLGLLDVPQGIPPFYQAARMTHAIISQYFDPYPPSEERIMRIAWMRQKIMTNCARARPVMMV